MSNQQDFMSKQELFSIRLSSGKSVPLQEGMTLHVEDLLGLVPAAAGGAVAEVSQNPNDPTAVGLKNLSQRLWIVTLADGSSRQVETSKNIKLVAGTGIEFGPLTDTIREQAGKYPLTFASEEYRAVHVSEVNQ